jgi:crotonobetainyl-CoA:carnitine CoA-transferase CaiB-like acyl-CoA transferase
LDGTPGSVRQAARWTVGADTAEVLRELGIDAGRLGQMAARGAALAPAEHGASRR